MDANSKSVTLEDIENEIVGEFYFTGEEAVLGAYKANGDVYQGSVPGPATAPTMKLLTICVLVLKNGIKIVGTSACVNAEIFDRDKGRVFARKEAIEQCWPLLGFRLADLRETEALKQSNLASHDFQLFDNSQGIPMCSRCGVSELAGKKKACSAN